MPKFTRYSRRRFGRRRRSVPWYRKRYSALQLAGKAYKAARYLKSVINVEKKVLTTAISNQPDSSTGTVVHLTPVDQGDTMYTRDGNSIKVTYVGLRLNCAINGSASTTFLRILVVKDNQQVADTTPNYSDVVDGVTTYGFLNTQHLGRFNVLYDKTITFAIDANSECRAISINIPMQHHIRYNGGNGTDIQKGGIYLMMCSDQATNTPYVSGEARVRFIDN